MNTTFCVAPWVNIGVVPNGEYTLCCVSKNYEVEDKDPFLDQRELYGSDKENELCIGSLHDNTFGGNME